MVVSRQRSSTPTRHETVRRAMLPPLANNTRRLVRRQGKEAGKKAFLEQGQFTEAGRQAGRGQHWALQCTDTDSAAATLNARLLERLLAQVMLISGGSSASVCGLERVNGAAAANSFPLCLTARHRGQPKAKQSVGRWSREGSSR